jgi:lipoprotein-anchoring transpeptidase ErfK/SrfK
VSVGRPNHRLAVALGVALAIAVGACTPSAPAGREPRDGPADRAQENGSVPPDEQHRSCEAYTLIGVMRAPRVVALRHPGDASGPVGAFPQVNAQGARQVFPILRDRYADGRMWHEVLLPIRPNGSTGWIPANAVTLRRSDYRIEVDLKRFRLELFDRCDRVESFRIGIGTKDTPTPRGTFFLNSLLKPPDPNSVYGALAFGLSGYSDTITDWVGGGIVGLHGTNDPSSLGRRVSHGCIRMANDAIREIARTVPLGTIVQIG